LIALGTAGWAFSLILTTVAVGLLQALHVSGHYRALTSQWLAGAGVGILFTIAFFTISYALTAFFSKRFRSYFILPPR
jgi:hypothetical protein